MSYAAIVAENIELKDEIRKLQLEVANLTERINILGKHPNLVKGLQGETLVVSLLNGIQTGSTASFDVDLQGRDITIEVKNSRLNKVLVGKTNTKRWNWARPFGEQGGKIYSQLILVGDADPDYKHLYLDPV